MAPVVPRPTTPAVLLLGLLLLVLPAAALPTGAVFSDTATTTTGTVGAGVFVPAAANPVACSTSGTVLNPASVITFTTPRVAEPPRGTVEYVLRLYRTDLNQQVGGTYLMAVGPSVAALAFDGGGLTLLQNTPYQARVTTRLVEANRESTPARTRSFTNSGLLIANFTCGAAG